MQNFKKVLYNYRLPLPRSVKSKSVYSVNIDADIRKYFTELFAEKTKVTEVVLWPAQLSSDMEARFGIKHNPAAVARELGITEQQRYIFRRLCFAGKGLPA